VIGDRAPGSGGPWPSRGLALALSLAILTALVSRVPLGEVAAAFRSVGPWTVAATALAALIEGVLVDLDKIRRILWHLGFRLPIWEVARLAMPAVALGAVAPVQAEEVWKARQIRDRLGCPFGEALGIVAFDRGINLASHLVLAAGGLGAWWLDSGSGPVLAGSLTLAFLAALGGISGTARLVPAGSPGRHGGLASFTLALRNTTGGFRAGMLAYACLANLVLTVALWWMGVSAGAEWNLSSALAWRAGSVLCSKIPVSLGGLGIREGVLAAGLSRWTSEPVAVAVGLAFGLTTAVVPPLFALGFRSWFRESMDLMIRDLRRGSRFLHRGCTRDSERGRSGSRGTGRGPAAGPEEGDPGQSRQDQDPRQSQDPAVPTGPGGDGVRQRIE